MFSRAYYIATALTGLITRLDLFSKLLVFCILLLLAQLHFLSFHIAVEGLTVLVAWCVALVGWRLRHARHFSHLFFLAIVYFWVGILDLLHLLSFEGMQLVFVGDMNRSLQFWLLARGTEVSGLFLMLLLAGSGRTLTPTLGVIAGLVVALILGIEPFAYFPSAYRDDSGLTAFKVYSEYLLIAVLLCVAYRLRKPRRAISDTLRRRLLWSVLATAAAELCFTRYVATGDSMMVLGHLFKLLSFFWIYCALVEHSLPQIRYGTHVLFAQDLLAADSYVLIMSLSGELIELNSRLLAFAGYRPGELNGKLVFCLDSDMLPDELSVIVDAVSAGERVVSESHLRLRDGRLHPVVVEISLIDRLGVPFLRWEARDLLVPESHHTRELKERRLHQLLQSTADGILGIDRHGHCNFINQRALTLLGYDTDTQLLGRELHALIHHSYPDGWPYPVSECPIYRAVQGGDFDKVVRQWFWRRDGSVFPVELRLETLRNERSEIDGVVVSFSDINERLTQEQLLSHQAQHDELTGLPNRKFFNDLMAEKLRVCRGQKNALALLFVDLDGFKPINDRCGHAIGDIVLQTVAARLQRLLRPSDCVARFGGDEFVAVVQGDDVRSAAQRVAKNMIDAVSQPIHIEQHALRLSCSIGIAIRSDDAEDIETLLVQADQAMYRAKNSGCGQLCFFQPGLQVVKD